MKGELHGIYSSRAVRRRYRISGPISMTAAQASLREAIRPYGSAVKPRPDSRGPPGNYTDMPSGSVVSVELSDEQFKTEDYSGTFFRPELQ
jgi:hypothetical protein